MVPELLTLKNFLSYREVNLDFRGLHTACICGPNGSGKSSLLEAITWALWGQSRAGVEDDVIRVGERETRVDFRFRSHQHTYRAIRARQRGHSSSLEFQIETPDGFRSLTQKGLRATQQAILDRLKLDYDTFTNSAYLRQGRADEFMLKRPSERKQVLADLLKLSQYDELAEQSRDRARQFKGQAAQLEQNSQTLTDRLQQRDAIETERKAVEETLALLQQEQDTDTQVLKQLQAAQQQRQAWEQQQTLQAQQHDNLRQDCDRIQQELAQVQQAQQQLEALFTQADDIEAGYGQLQTLQTEEETTSRQFQEHQQLQTERQQVQQAQTDAINQLQGQVQQINTQLEELVRQEEEVQHTLKKKADVQAAMTQLQQARSHLEDMDRLQTEVSPLMQRRQQLQSDLDRQRTRLLARLEELQSSSQQLTVQKESQESLRQAVSEVEDRIQHLEQRRIYQQRVREHGLERRNFLERLQERQQDYQAQLEEMARKMELLGQPNAPCPLCDRPLDEEHWQVVQERHQSEEQELCDRLLVVKDQLSVSDREIQTLRQEYRDLEKELEEYGTALERRGQLQEQLQGALEAQAQLQQILAEIEQLEKSLETGDYAADAHRELALLEEKLAHLNYDDKTHALARGEAERWRWAEIKQAEVDQAERRLAQIQSRQPESKATLTDLQTQLEAVPQSELQQQLDNLDRRLADIGYNLERHNQLRAELRQAQTWQLRYQELNQARQQAPQLAQRIGDLQQTLDARSHALQASQTQLDQIHQQLTETPDNAQEIQTLEQQRQQRREQLDAQLGNLGRLQQQQQQLEELQQQLEEQKEQLIATRRQHRVYQELAQAFGKNGIQALMIENILPQLEAETNQILARLSANQLHVQFVTQRLGRSGRASARKAKTIDTLDILIADARGTRSYETYSGGEAFRINFAIRLALARLLAQRSGAALQLLIVDEGFGTQDREGCERLVAAINAIAADFACILAVTHMPHFKEAFQSRIEVSKGQEGSRLELLL